MVGVINDSGVLRSRVSICNVLQMPNHLCLQPQSLQICLKPAVNLILMVQHLSLSHALAPSSLLSPRCSLLFFPVLSQNSLSFHLVLSLSAEGPWIYQAKLGNTDSDRGNVDRVTSHALTCPNARSSANHRLRIYLHDFHSALCHLFTLFQPKQRVG